MARMATMMKFEADQRTTNPTCTGSALFAVMYKDGVVVAGDKQVSYGKMNRYGGYSRIFKVNNKCVVAFGGDHADFQFVERLLNIRQMEFRNEMNNPDADMSPVAVHTFLTCVLYQRRCKVDPLFVSLLVCGVSAENKPYLSTITMRGVAYPQQYIATGLGAMLVQQTLENEFRQFTNKDGTSNMTREQAIATMKTAATLQFYHDCLASTDFEACTIDAKGVTAVPVEPKEVQGTWHSLAEVIEGYD